MVFEHQGEYPSQWKAIESVSAKLTINHETLRLWVRRAETDAGAGRGGRAGAVQLETLVVRDASCPDLER